MKNSKGRSIFFLALCSIAAAPQPSSASKLSGISPPWWGWRDTAIPLRIGGYDVRQYRQYVYFTDETSTPNLLTAEAVAFAAQHKGFLYYAGDEPDARGIAPEYYAYLYYNFVRDIRAVDPTARFSPAGTVCDNSYKDQFYNYYTAIYGPLPVDEWIVNCGPDYSSDPWVQESKMQEYFNRVNSAVNWSVARGAPVFLQFSLWPWPATVDISSTMRRMLDHALAQPYIVGASWWHYDWHPPGGGLAQDSHWLAYPGGALTLAGEIYQSYCISTPSPAWSGAGPLADFTNDGFADFGDYWHPYGHFWIHRNQQNGYFDSANWASGTAAPSPGWRALVGDFTGDGYADYADYQVSSGTFWVHENLRNGAFDTNVWGWSTVRKGADWEVLVDDFTGDGHADLMEHQLSTGLIWIKKYAADGGWRRYEYVNADVSVGRVQAGANWRLLVADFTGDGLADFADQDTSTGRFWIHKNLGGGTYRMSGAVAGEGSAAGGPAWKTLVGDFTGDGFADYADLDRATGVFYIHENYGNGTFRPFGTHWGYGYTAVGADWKVLGQ